jgi:hypothetical protein
MDRRRFVVAVAAAAPAAVSAKLARAQDTDAEFQQYIGSITAIMNMLGWFFDEVGTLTSNSTEADYVDEEWRLDVLGPFSIALAAQEVIATLDPPSMLAESHGYLAESVDHLVIAGEYMRDGVLNLNVESINLAVESMLRANDLIDQANEAMPQIST